MNKATEEVMGKLAEDVIGRDDTCIFTDSEAILIMARDQKVLQARKTMTMKRQQLIFGGTFLRF